MGAEQTKEITRWDWEAIEKRNKYNIFTAHRKRKCIVMRRSKSVDWKQKLRECRGLFEQKSIFGDNSGGLFNVKGNN